MDEYIVPDHEVEIVASEEVTTEERVPTVCYEVPLVYAPNVKQEDINMKEETDSCEPGEYIEGSNEESVESHTEVETENMNDDKMFSLIPRSIENPKNNQTTFLTHECVYVLVKWVFERRYNPFPTDAQKSQLSTITKLPIPEIEIWLSKVRKSIVPMMIMKGAEFINSYMKYHIENVKAQGRITVANFHNKRLLLKKIGNQPVIIGKIQYSPQTPQKIQYVVPIAIHKANNTGKTENDSTPKIIYKTASDDINYEDVKANQIQTEKSKGIGVATNKPLDMNAARYLMTWLFNYRDNPFPSIEQLRHISDVTGLPGAQVLRWMFTARKRILKKVRLSSTVLNPEMYKDCLTWHLNDLPGPKRMKQHYDAGSPPLDGEKKIKNTFDLSNNKKSPFKMETSISGDDSYNGSDGMESHYDNKRKKGDRNLTNSKRLFVKSEAEELHPSETLNYSQPIVNKGASRKGKGNFPLSSKKVLMDWLFKNRHNPYPTDQEKAELSEMSNLTLLQVNNWFINARRRFLDKMLKTGEECFLIKRQHKGFKDLSKPYLRESGEVETEIVSYSEEIMINEDNNHQSSNEIQITEYVCTDDQTMVEYHQEVPSGSEYHMGEHGESLPSNMIEVQVHLLPTIHEEQGSVVRVRCTEEEAVHVLKAVNSHPTVTLDKIPDSVTQTWEIIEAEEEEGTEETIHELLVTEGASEEVVSTEVLVEDA